ncbi:MAG: hypothetical protein KKA10_04885 [Euryarchaeota archaeon]|nr:hypothetical protein [Euryarchaeota archaeon]MCG2736946.1 hypothetical protein [Candidatus Methanoperedenaceae archaeon]
MAKIYEFHARYSLYLKPDFAQMEAIDFLTGKEKQPPKSWQELSEVSDPSARLSLLTQAIITAYKDYSRVGRRRDAGLLGSLGRLEQYYEEQYNNFLSPLCLNPVIPDISMFPQGSWAVNFNFKLKKPYISRDDTDFYIIDNPVRKEWVFKMPYIAASQWKGAMRASMVKQLVEKADSLLDEEFAKRRFRLALMFGDEKGEGEEKIKGLAEYLDNEKPSAASLYRKKILDFFHSENIELPSHAGWLCFYPTYFTRIGLEVINPHNRGTGAGAQPIYFECVPSGAEGGFVLLYVPLCRTGEDRDTIKNHAILDLQLIAHGISALMTQFGFGSKTSGGFGLAEDFVSGGFVALDVEGIGDNRDVTHQKCEIPEKFKKYVNDDGTVKVEFCGSGESGLLSNKEFGERKKAKGWNSTEFQEFRNWHKVHGEGIVKEKRGMKGDGRRKGLEFKNFEELKNSINFLAKKIIGEDGFA